MSMAEDLIDAMWDQFLYEGGLYDEDIEKPYIWTTKQGRRIPIQEMTAPHIDRCMKMVGEDNQWYYIFTNELARRERVLKNLGLGGTVL